MGVSIAPKTSEVVLEKVGFLILRSGACWGGSRNVAEMDFASNLKRWKWGVAVVQVNEQVLKRGAEMIEFRFYLYYSCEALL